MYAVYRLLNQSRSFVYSEARENWIITYGMTCSISNMTNWPSNNNKQTTSERRGTELIRRVAASVYGMSGGCCIVAHTFLFALSVVGITLTRCVCVCVHVCVHVCVWVCCFICNSFNIWFRPCSRVCSFCFQFFEHDWCDLNAAAIRFLWFFFFRSKKKAASVLFTHSIEMNLNWK